MGIARMERTRSMLLLPLLLLLRTAATRGCALVTAMQLGANPAAAAAAAAAAADAVWDRAQPTAARPQLCGSSMMVSTAALLGVLRTHAAVSVGWRQQQGAGCCGVLSGGALVG
jgi:hypothetical protein